MLRVLTFALIRTSDSLNSRSNKKISRNIWRAWILEMRPGSRYTFISTFLQASRYATSALVVKQRSSINITDLKKSFVFPTYKNNSSSDSGSI